MTKIHQLLSFLRFYASSKGIQAMHSPFLYHFYSELLSDEKWFYVFRELDVIRGQLNRYTNLIDIVDYGAGSTYDNPPKKTIQSIVEQQVSSSYQLRFIWRIINHFQSQTILELGSSIGLSTMYLASANPNAQVKSLEGNPAFIQLGKKMAAQLSLDNIEFIEGEFETTLLPAVRDFKKVDLVFLDGNHTKEATLHYYNLIEPYLHENSIVLVDDIYWSRDMEEMWVILKEKQEVRCSIDVYHMGILFFRKEFKEKIAIKMRPAKWL